MFVASIIKIKTIDKDVLDSEWTLTSCALRLVFTCQQIRICTCTPLNMQFNGRVADGNDVFSSRRKEETTLIR